RPGAGHRRVLSNTGRTPTRRGASGRRPLCVGPGDPAGRRLVRPALPGEVPSSHRPRLRTEKTATAREAGTRFDPSRGVSCRHAWTSSSPLGRAAVTWTQSYDPLGSWPLSTLVAAVPVVVLLGLLASGKANAWQSSLAGLVAAVAVAVGVFH